MESTEIQSSDITMQPEQVKRWQDRVSVARKSSEVWENESGAKRFVDEYNGKYFMMVKVGDVSTRVDLPPANEVFAYVQADLANTYNRDPHISVNPTAGTVLGAKLREAWLNYKWRKLRLKEQLESEIIDKDLVGFAWHKVGHSVESEGEGDNLKIVKEGIYSMKVDWKDIVWNIGAKNPPYDCIWMAQRITRPLNEVKRKYNLPNLKGVKSPDIDDSIYKASLYKDDIEFAVLWEIWDSETKTVYLTAEGETDKFLDVKPWPEYLEEFPFLMYWDYECPGKPRPMSAIAPWETQILEGIFILSSAVNHVKRWSRQMIYKHGSIDEKALDKFELGVDGAAIPNTGSGNLQENVMMTDFGQLPTDYYLILDRLNAIKRDINGQPEIDRGSVTKTNTRTIGELQLIKAGAKGRTDRKIDRLESHIENIARHMMAHWEANFDFEEVVKITGDTPEEVIEALGDKFDPITQTVKISPQDIAGEYEVDVKAGSTLPLDKQTRMEILDLVLKTLGSADPAVLASPLIATLVQEILDNYDIKSLEEAFQAQLLMQKQQMEMQDQVQSVEEQKIMTQAKKQNAQADQINAETEIIVQDAMMGPEGRAEMKKKERPEPTLAKK